MTLVRLEHWSDRPISEVTLASPSTRNALSQAMLRELLETLDTVHERALAGTTRVVVLQHEPPVFSAGLDLGERRAGSADQSSGHLLAQVIAGLMTMPVPTVAVVNGAVRAGGIGLIAACDMSVVRRSVDFAFNEVRIGVAPAIISVPLLARCSWSSLAAPFLASKVLSAEDALRIGLVTHLIDDDMESVWTVFGICLGVLEGAPGAVAATKALLRGTDAAGIRAALESMARRSDELFGTDEAAEGIAAFFEKRPPSWWT